MASAASLSQRPDTPGAGIGYLWVPHLPLAVALRARPDLEAECQVIIGSRPAVDGIATDASEECLAAGVQPGRPLREARECCPRAVVLQADPEAEHRAHEALLDLAGAVAAEVEEDGLGRAYFALDRPRQREDCRWLLATLRALIRERLGFQARLALAPGRFTARVAAERDPEAERGAPVILSGEAAAFLAPLPLDALPLSPGTLDHLRAVGIATVGRLARLPRGGLARRFGPEAVEAHRLAHGEDTRSVVGRTPPEVRTARHPFDPGVETVAPLLAVAERLLVRLCAAVQAEGRTFRSLIVTAEGEDGSSCVRSAELRAAATGPQQCRAALRTLVETAAPGGPVVAISVTLATLEQVTAEQVALFEDVGGRPERRRRLEAATREVGRRYPARLRRIVPRDVPTLLDEYRFALLPYELNSRHPAPPEIPPASLRSVRVERIRERPYLAQAGRRDELVAVCGCWRADEWWPAAVSRVYWRVRARSGRVITLSRDEQGWRLVEIMD